MKFQLIWATATPIANNSIQHLYSKCFWDFHIISSSVNRREKYQKVPGSNPTRCLAGLRILLCYKAPSDLWVKIVKTQWLTSGGSGSFIMAQSWMWRSQVEVKKIILNIGFIVCLDKFLAKIDWMQSFQTQHLSRKRGFVWTFMIFLICCG